ncbi:efflux RND transporter periplasmic adaptor subunit [Croceitalea sp. P059]|uniref:efflux RND transporter periplasmic adaptor subunit n=1 Tax=Croceitalea sp. P059 TaxID=3075601 RepID=UPI0028873653|nr:efflux RND transporter periplasmic adaptor subunit [Croceitalea sp. P059]MDT0540969.1 efflux RND transporter periplasmic adaptor subunit [Croceitalea sp. P059]
MLKKLITYFVFAIIGLLLGYFIFGTTSEVSDLEINESVNPIGKWSCSMHPQIDDEENGVCPLCNMDLVFTSDVKEKLSSYQFRMSDDAITLANIQTIRVGIEPPNNSILKLSGVITTNKENDAVQTTLFDGRIDKLYQNSIGEKIRKGQEIGLIYSPELYAAQDKLLTSISYRDTHKKLFNSARNTLGLWKLNDKQIEEILEAGKPIVNFPLFADVTGTITEILASEGGYYSQGDPLFKTSDLRTLWGEFDAYESQLSFLKIGQEIDIQLTSFPNEKINAKITYIEPLVNKEKRTVLVRVFIKNQKGILKPGMFAKALVNQVNLNKELPILPKSAVLWTGKRSVVYKKPFSDKSIFEMVEVELGRRLGDFYEIQSGIREGDVIVNEGAFTIDAAAQLKGKKSMMSNKTIDSEIHHHENMKMELKDVPEKKDLSAHYNR